MNDSSRNPSHQDHTDVTQQLTQTLELTLSNHWMHAQKELIPGNESNHINTFTTKALIRDSIKISSAVGAKWAQN